MLITENDIRAIRPIANNLNAKDRLLPYIEEAENLFVIDTLGAANYKAISEDASKFDLVLNGGYYEKCGQTAHLVGLKAAIAYLAYSRFLLNQQVNVTSFGVVVKNGELSNPVDNKQVIYQSNQAKEIGLKYLNEVAEYLSICRTRKNTWPKIRVIG